MSEIRGGGLNLKVTLWHLPWSFGK